MLKGHVSHSPRLVIDASDVKPPDVTDSQEVKNGRILDDALDLPDGHQYFVWDLTGCKFEIVGAPSIGIVEGGRNANSSKPTEDPHGKMDQPDDFSWIPEIHKTCGVPPVEATANPVFLDEKQLPSTANARMMKLVVDPSATAKNNWLEAQIGGTISQQPVFDFGANGYKQVLADKARLTMQFAQLPIKLRLTRYKDGFTREILLQPRPGGTQISISLSNMPNTREGYDPEIKHFSAYQDVLLKPLNTCKLPKEQSAVGAPSHHLAPVKCTLCSSCGPDL